MNILFDTNIFIPLEPGSLSHVEESTESAIRLHRTLTEAGHVVYLHPDSRLDLDRDSDRERSQLRRLLFDKYPLLPDPPGIGAGLEAAIGAAPEGSNDWVDNRMLAAVERNAVEFLVSEDRRLLRKARRAGLQDRVVQIEALLVLCAAWAGAPAAVPPAVDRVRAHSLDREDPIFESFRDDYPEFDDWWLNKCCLEHRETFRIAGRDGRIAGFCVIKPEAESLGSRTGPALKLCSFKIAEEHLGLRYGELLLKAVFEHAGSEFEAIYVDVYPRHEHLVDLFTEFGFESEEEKATGELRLVKDMRHPERSDADALAQHIAFGPAFVAPGVQWHLVPIQPKYSDLLFPETASITALFSGAFAFGNAIRKAYLCKAQSRQVRPGDAVVFYRSQHEQRRGAVAVGVVERTLASSDPGEILREVSRRTVYTQQEVEDLCAGEVLVILFRQARILQPPLSLSDLREAGVCVAPPQSIMTIPEQGAQWLSVQMKRSR